ncbi:hypothetical protein [Clostridioides sp. ES-S-0048-02]|nr:hypothetical protein [Clostridioides sp. ES-S-0048-02]
MLRRCITQFNEEYERYYPESKKLFYLLLSDEDNDIDMVCSLLYDKKLI